MFPASDVCPSSGACASVCTSSPRSARAEAPDDQSRKHDRRPLAAKDRKTNIIGPIRVAADASEHQFDADVRDFGRLSWFCLLTTRRATLVSSRSRVGRAALPALRTKRINHRWQPYPAVTGKCSGTGNFSPTPPRSRRSSRRRGTPRSGACGAPRRSAGARAAPPAVRTRPPRTPSVATFTSSCVSTSVADTLNPDRTRSRIDRTTCRLSFSVRHSRTSNRTSSVPITIGMSVVAVDSGSQEASEQLSSTAHSSTDNCLLLQRPGADLDLERLDHVVRP